MADRTVSINLLGTDNTSRAFNSAARSANNTEKAFGRTGAAFGKVGKTMARSARLGAVALIGMGAAGTVMGLKTAAGLEQAQIGFETMLGSGVKAQRFLEKLKKFAAATPFNLPGLIDNSRQLLGVGVAAKNVIPFLTDFGDAAGALGIQQDGFNRIMLAMSQSISAGKIKLGDMNQLMNNGLPIWGLLSKAIGKSVPEIQNMIQHGDLLTKDVLPKLQAQMHKDYGGAMAKQSQTLSGLWSTFMDTLNLGLADAIKPLAVWLKDKLPGAIQVMGDALKKIPALTAPIIQKIKDALPAIKTALKTWADAFATAFSFVKVDVAPIVAQVAGKAKAAGAAVISGINVGIKTGDWSALGTTVGDGIGKALAGGAGIGSKMVTAFASVDWLGLGKRAGAAALPFAVGLSTGILSAILPFIVQHPLAVVELAAAIIPLGKLAKVIGPLAEKIGLPLIPGMLRGVEKSGGMVEKAFMRLFRGAGRAIQHVAPDLKFAVDFAVLRAVEAVKAFGGRMLSAGKSLARSLLNGITAPLKGLGDYFFSVGASMVQGLIRGIGSLAGAAAKAAKDMVGGAIKSAWDAIKPGSPSKVFTWLGETVPAGFAKGIKAGSKKAIAAMKDMVDSVKGKLGDLKSQARDIASAASDAVKGVLDVSAIGAAVETTVAGVTTPGRSIIDPVTGQVTTTADVTSADVTTSRTPSAASTLAGFAGQATAFAAALAAMAKKGLAPALIAAVAAAGPVGGLTAAQALVSESKADDATVNAAMASIGKSGLAAGNTVLSTTRIPADIKREEKQLAAAERIEKLLRDGLVAEVKIKGDDLYVVLKRAEKNAARKK